MKEEGIINSSLKLKLFNTHKKDDNKGKLKAYLPLKHIFGFCRSFR